MPDSALQTLIHNMPTHNERAIPDAR